MNRNVTRSGKTVHCEWYNSFLYDHEGQVVSTYSLITDVSERVKVMDEHEKSVRSFQDLFDSISDAIYLVNDEGRIIFLSFLIIVFLSISFVMSRMDALPINQI